MPALVAFGRRWQVGTDDFVFPGILDSTVKTCWLIAAIIVFAQNDSSTVCANGLYMKIYFYIMIIALSLTILTDISIVNKSMSGAMMDTEVRKYVVPLIYVRLFWEALDIGWNIVGTIWAYGETLHCVGLEAPRELAFIKRFIFCNWMSVVFLSLFLTYLFDPLGRDHLSTKSQSQRDDYIAYEPPETRRSLFWERRCKMYCCFCCDVSSPDDSMKQDGFHEVGKLLANLVQDYDLLPSDILAGLIALYRKSKLQSINCINTEKMSTSFKPRLYIKKNETIIKSQPKCGQINFNTSEFRDEIILLNHYFKFINGLNGWKGFISDNQNHNKKTMISFWKKLICCGCFKHIDGITVEGDNCCYCGTAVLKELSVPNPISEENLIHVSFVNDYYQVPFYLAVDHYTKSYILTLRGTFSGMDVITDLTAWPVPTGIPGLPETYLVHHGVLLTARNAKAKIEVLGLLANMKSIYPEYKLMILGQSLGSAVAVVLGMMLMSEFPDLKVIAFSPPGGLLNLEASIWSTTFTTSVVYGTDIISRLSLLALEKFRSKVIETIEDCRTPKYKLLMGYCSCCCFGFLPNIKFRSCEETNNSESYIQIDGSKFPKSTSKKTQTQVSLTPMYLPGKILHVTERNRSEMEIDSNTELRYEMRWAERNDFLEILASPRMYSDHWPFRMLSAFREYLKDGEQLDPYVTTVLSGNDNKAFEPC